MFGKYFNFFSRPYLFRSRLCDRLASAVCRRLFVRNVLWLNGAS